MKSSAPFFSIIVPSYNRVDCIEIALNSIFEQTFQDFEIILVDDGSIDQTENVLKKISDKRFRYYKKKNKERSIARNFGIEKAIGQYINFLDSDDKFYSHHLEAAYSLILDNDLPKVCHLGYEIVNRQGVVLFQRNKFDENLSEKIILENIMSCNAVFIDREIAVKYPFIQNSNAIISEDWYVWLRLASRFKIVTNNEITSAVVEHNSRSLNNLDIDKLINSTELIIDHLKMDEVFLEKYQEKANKFFSDRYLYVMLMLALRRRRKDYFSYAVKALQEDLWAFKRKNFFAPIKYLLFPFLIKGKY